MFRRLMKWLFPVLTTPKVSRLLGDLLFGV